MRILVATPSYRGITDEEANEHAATKALADAGHKVGVAVIRGLALVDLARAELTAAFMSTECDAVLYIDDDVTIDPKSLLDMIKADRDVVSAPCRMRSEGNLFNITPIGPPEESNGVRIAPCFWTGLGCVLVKRGVIERMQTAFHSMHYRSDILNGARGYALFNSILVPMTAIDPSAPAGENCFLGDDRAFSARLNMIKISIWASIDAKTNHRGLEGCFGAEVAKREPKLRLVGADGRPL